MLLVLLLVAGWPLLRTVYYAFTDATLFDLDYHEVVGLLNFRLLATDPEWWRAVWNTLLFAAVSVTLETVLGLVIALTLNAKLRARGPLRAAMLIPWAIPTVVSAQMWGWMLHDQYGVINAVLLSLGIISQPWAWVADPVARALVGGRRGCLEDDAFHGAADPRRAAAGAGRGVRGGADRRARSGRHASSASPCR